MQNIMNVTAKYIDTYLIKCIILLSNMRGIIAKIVTIIPNANIMYFLLNIVL